MNRREFIASGMAMGLGTGAAAAWNRDRLDDAAQILADATEQNEIESSALFVRQGSEVFARTFGKADSIEAIFLLASISKTIAIAAVMTLHDEGGFQLDDPVAKYIPELQGEARRQITMRQLMTHVSGLPDQVPENAKLRAAHAPLSEFVAATIKTPLLFEPGERFSYSSMAILLATEVGRRISGQSIAELTEQRIYKPLGMTRSAMGLGSFELSDLIMNQVERAAPESGAGDPSTKSWDWNSPYWRKLGAPWGTAHGSAVDLATFLHELLHPTGKILRDETIAQMISNQNAAGIESRGLGFDVGTIGDTPLLSNKTFGHTGSTGTICWADPATDTICVILTTLPARAVTPHPRDQASAKVAAAVHAGG